MEKLERLKEIESLLLEMFKAKDEYGCGYYNQDSFLTPYKKLEKLVGFKSKDDFD